MNRFKCDFSSRFRILKGGKISLVVSALLASTTLVFAAPNGESVVSGNVQIDRTTPNTTNITQSTNKSIINWQSFSVAENETVNFNMPSATSSSLNRVIGNEASAIYGKINSNGQVFLVNQNGIYFGKDSQVNTAGFVASTKNISDENFLHSNYIFEGNSQTSIINLGTITTDNAYTALLAKKVENEGVIKAHLGSIQLASGERFTLDINGNSLVKLTIDKSTLDGLISNKGAIIADGGKIYLTTSALDEVLNGLVNNTGIIQANAVEEKDGKIILFAHVGTGEFGGTIEANGGFVETSGKVFVNKDDLTVKASHWLIDPNDITIDATLAGTISTSLESGDVTVDTTTSGSAGNGDIFVNSDITKANGTEQTLTLKAERDIVLNDGISISSTSDKLNTVFWSDTDGNEEGGVVFQQNSSVITNDGHLWVGGGSGSTTWNGLTVGDSFAGNLHTIDSTGGNAYGGINVSDAILNSGTGNIYLYGKSKQTDYRYSIGARIVGVTQIIGNDITIKGIGSANAQTANDTNRGNWGVDIEHSATVTSTGDIVIEGTGGGSSVDGTSTDSAGSNYGVRIASTAKVEATGSGNINITGIGGGKNGATYNLDNDGINISGSAQIITSSGDITLTGTKGYNANSESVRLNADATDKQIKSTNGGTITIIADDISIGSTQRLSSSGNLIIKPKTADTTIGIGGASGTLALASSYFSTNFVDGFNSITIGDATAGTITIGGTTTYNDNLTFKTASDIFTNTSTTLTSSGANSLVFWSDSDGNENGSIYLKDSSSITTNGGNLWMGGGDGSTTWHGLTVGDDYAYAGSIHVITTSQKNGITLYKSAINTNGGDIALYGKSKNQSGGTGGYMGIYQEQTTINSGTGNIDISAITTGSANDGSWHYGLLMGTLVDSTESSIISTSGIITINGETSFSENTYGSGIGLYSFGNANSIVKIQSTSGAINLTGKLNSTGYDGQYGGIYLYGNGKEMIVSQSGAISLSGTSANSNVAGINVHPGNTTSYIGYDGTNPYSGDITLNSNTKISFEGSIVANNLNLLGSGVNYTLNSAFNNINTLTANTGKVVFVDSDGLTLETITATDIIDIATLSGDITLNGNIATTDTTDNAIKINAGKNESAGTATGGNIIHTNGTILVGNGGRATLYSGSYTSGNGFDLLVSSNDYRKFNSDETTVFNPALGGGKYLVYRENTTPTTTTPTTTPTTSNTINAQTKKIVDTIKSSLDKPLFKTTFERKDLPILESLELSIANDPFFTPQEKPNIEGNDIQQEQNTLNISQEMPNQSETPKNQEESITQAQSLQASQNTQTIQKQNNITQNLSNSQELQESLQTYEKGLADQGFNQAQSQTIANVMLKTSLSNPNATETTVKKITQAMKLDQESPTSALANGTLEDKGGIFNQTLQNLLAKGVEPKEAYATALEASTHQVPNEINIAQKFTALSDTQAKLALNLIAKGYSTNEAFEIAQKTSFPKESEKSQIVSGEVSQEHDYLGNYLGKYPLDEALKLALQTKAQKEKYEKIDANNVELAFSNNIKNGTVPHSLLFEKALINELRTNSFAVAYQNALQKVEKTKQHQPSPTESLSSGELKKNLTNGEKIWWIEFTKQTLNNKSQKEATLLANDAQKNYEEKMKKVKLVENRLKGKK